MSARTNRSTGRGPRDHQDGNEVQLMYPADAFPDLEPLVKPLAHAYVRADLVRDVHRALDGMRALANANGYELEDALVFADHDSTAMEFAALRHEIGRTEARAVFIPSPQHLTSCQIMWLRQSGTGVWATDSQTCWPATASSVGNPASVSRCPSGDLSGFRDESTNEAQRFADRLIDEFRREHRSDGDRDKRSHLPPRLPYDQ